MARPKAIRTEPTDKLETWQVKMSTERKSQLKRKAADLGLSMQELGDEVVESVLNNRIETRVVRKLEKNVAAIVDDPVRLAAFMKFEQQQQQQQSTNSKKGAA